MLISRVVGVEVWEQGFFVDLWDQLLVLIDILDFLVLVSKA